MSVLSRKHTFRRWILLLFWERLSLHIRMKFLIPRENIVSTMSNKRSPKSLWWLVSNGIVPHNETEREKDCTSFILKMQQKEIVYHIKTTEMILDLCMKREMIENIYVRISFWYISKKTDYWAVYKIIHDMLHVN